MQIRETETRWVDIDQPMQHVAEFLSKPQSWMKCAVSSLKTNARTSESWSYADTHWGTGELRIDWDRQRGTLNQRWKGVKHSWVVPTRVMRNGEGATLIMTLPKFADMPEWLWKQCLVEWERDLKLIKLYLESGAETSKGIELESTL